MDAPSLLVQAIARHVAERPDAVAIIEGERETTWRELDLLARHHAARLASAGIVAGERVAVMAPASTELVAAVLAHLRLGVVHVPVNTRYRDDEVQYVVGHAGARCLLTDVHARDTTPIAAWPEPPPASHLAWIVYTSGTTGRPKGVMAPHRALAANLGAMMDLWHIGPSDRLVLALPLFHVHGLGLGVLGALVLAGASLLLQSQFDSADIVDAFAHHGATVFMGVPTMYHTLLAHLDTHPDAAKALASGRLFTAGSAALAAADFERFRAHTGHAILERYGMTETGFMLSNPYTGERRPGSVGLPVPGVEARIVDELGAAVGVGVAGEIEVRSEGLMDGYWQDPAATAAAFRDGWFRTGDIATADADGYFRIVGRASTDIIKSGGFKIGAREIEDVIRVDPRYAEVAVIGIPDAHWGEAIAVVVLPQAGVTLPGEDAVLADIRAQVGQQLADFKRPRFVKIVSFMPKNAMGKIQKTALRDLFARA